MGVEPVKLIGRVSAKINGEVVFDRKFNTINEEFKEHLAAGLSSATEDKYIPTSNLIDTQPWEAENPDMDYLLNNIELTDDVYGQSGIIVSTAGPSRQMYPMTTEEITPDVPNPAKARAWRGVFELFEADPVTMSAATLGFNINISGDTPLTINELTEPFELCYAYTDLGDRQLLQHDRLIVEWIIQVS